MHIPVPELLGSCNIRYIMEILMAIMWIFVRSLIPLAVSCIADKIIRNELPDESHPYYYLARYVSLGCWSVCVPASMCWRQIMIIREIARKIDELEDPAIKRRIHELEPPSSSSSSKLTLTVDDSIVSWKTWTAALFIPFVACLIRIAILPDNVDKWEAAKWLSGRYIWGCCFISLIVQSDPIIRFMWTGKFWELTRLHRDPVIKRRILELNKTSSSVSIQPEHHD
ncbi:unnamed protein product [Linum trigynum]|uniref:Uncharacterized protein n=1 Tax=Linum trigynum TaxID=586398 RepID=A0AAV2END7_9ROSI